MEVLRVRRGGGAEGLNVIDYKRGPLFLTPPLILLTDNCCSYEDNNVEKVQQVPKKERKLTTMKLISMMCMIMNDWRKFQDNT